MSPDALKVGVTADVITRDGEEDLPALAAIGRRDPFELAAVVGSVLAAGAHEDEDLDEGEPS
jgi:hypothetical protein